MKYGSKFTKLRWICFGIQVRVFLCTIYGQVTSVLLKQFLTTRGFLFVCYFITLSVRKKGSKSFPATAHGGP